MTFEVEKKKLKLSRNIFEYYNIHTIRPTQVGIAVFNQCQRDKHN